MKKTTHQKLTKSRFKLGCECPAKLYYGNHSDIYFNALGEDPFIKALADDGYQVGELARWMLCKDPANDLIDTLDKQVALEETAKRLSGTEATIAEAAFAFGDLFIRADVVVKSGDLLKLYEVKSKSWDQSVDFWTGRGDRRLNPKWEEYLLDVAFQQLVISRAYPDLKVQAYLVLLDKEKTATVDGLATKFTVTREGREVRVKSRFSEKQELGQDLLAYVNVDQDIADIHKLPFDLPRGETGSFLELIDQLVAINASGIPFDAGIGSKCKRCQFRFPADAGRIAALKAEGKKDGREECWTKAIGKNYDPGKPKIIDLWNFKKTDEMIKQGKCHLADLTSGDLGTGRIAERQLLQIKAAKQKEPTPWIDREILATSIESWKFPLHFIDFETARMALPMHKGMHPYMQVAFQFSHHIMDETGAVHHANQWIEPRAGVFPSFDFVRKLKDRLNQDDGTIFRYAMHENNVLRDIREQLEISTESDRSDLIAWIDSITEYKVPGANQKADKVKGPRNMVDLCEVVKASIYEPATHGSNSLKYILPAILGSSPGLRHLYAGTIKAAGIHSLNFDGDWCWLREGKGNNPYASLPSVFDGEDDRILSDYVAGLDDIDDGGAAMIAYAKLQYCGVTEAEREKIQNALLRYCELDTLAMVILYQYLQEVVAA